ncbi:hypothetical protein [Segetibacter sp.]|jgi:hypothetical protein|nr:hypothetical protein [Segetibacter sp.]MCW3080380.1 hypothetical protein [Segetibacter sp.]
MSAKKSFSLFLNVTANTLIFATPLKKEGFGEVPEWPKGTVC